MKDFSTESATENQTASVSQGTSVRVKRCGKSAPREAQATRHGKPHRVQGQIGNRGTARSAFRESETGFGYRSPRQMILSRRNPADRIRLTALPKPFLFKRKLRGETGWDLIGIHRRTVFPFKISLQICFTATPESGAGHCGRPCSTGGIVPGKVRPHRHAREWLR